MLNEIGKASEGVVSGAISGVAYLVENYQTLGKIIAGLITTYGAYRAAVIVNITLTRSWAVAARADAIAKGIQTTATNIATTATKALNAAMKANPYVLVATALVGLVSYMVLFNKEVSVAEKAQKAFNEEQERQKNLLQDERNEIERLIEVVKDENAAKGQRLNALNKLKDIYPDIFSKYKTEEELIRNIANALKEVNNAQKNKDLQMDKAYIERLKVQRNGLEAKLKTAANPVDIANYKEQIQGINIQIDKATKQHAWQSTLKRIDDIAELSADEQAKERKLMIEEYNRRHNAKQAKNQNLLKEGEKQDIRKTTLSPLATTGYENFSDADLGLIISKAKQLEEAEKERNKVIDTRNGLLAKQKELAEKISAIQSKGGQTQNDKDELSKLQKEKENIDKKLKGEYNEQSKKAATKTKKETLPEFDTEKANRDHQRQIQDDLFRQAEARIKIMQEGVDKRLAIIQLEYDKQEEEIRRRSQDQLVAFIENEKQKAAAAGKWKKGQDFDTNTEAINAEKARLAENEKTLLASNAEYQRFQQEQVYKELIDKYQTYFERRKSLIQKHETELKELRKTLSDEQLEEAKKQQKAELDQLDDAFLQKNKDFQKLFEDLRDLSNKEIEEAIKAAKKLLEITNMSEEMRKSINARIKDTERMFSQKKLADVHQYSQAISDLAKSFTELGDSTKNSTLSNLGGAIGNIASQFSNLMGALDRYKSGNISSADKVGAVLGFASNLISSFANSARQRKEAEEQYYNSVINYQNAYNLALIEQKRIQKELEGSFLLKDRTEQLKNEFDTIRDIGKQQEKQLEQIRQRGQMKIGTGTKTDWGGVAGTTAGGAVAGAMIGGPVGAAIGAAVGLFGGLFGSKKPKDIFGDLLKNWPNLLEQSANGMWKINKAQAETAKNSGLVNEETKMMLQNYINLETELEKSREKIKDIVTEFAGNLAPNIQNSLVEAFKAGENAIEKMGETMDKVVENMVASLIFQSTFKETFKKLETDMQKSMDIGGDGNWVDDFGRFYREAGQKTKQYYEALAQARDSAKMEGFNILKDNSQRQATEKGFARMSQDTGNELLGQFRLQTQLSAEIKNAALQTANFIKEMHQSMQTNAAQQLRHLAGIEANTYKLNKIETDIASVKTILGNIDTKGIKMRT